MELTEVVALRACARMMNTQDVSHIEPLLDEDVHFSSQWMVGKIPSKRKLATDRGQTGGHPAALRGDSYCVRMEP